MATSSVKTNSVLRQFWSDGRLNEHDALCELYRKWYTGSFMLLAELVLQLWLCRQLSLLAKGLLIGWLFRPPPPPVLPSPFPSLPRHQVSDVIVRSRTPSEIVL